MSADPFDIDPEELLAVIEKHSATVTLALLCDLMAVIGMRLRVSIVEIYPEQSA
jgi:uncharacterized protein YejL (UPF0352 family)